MSVKQGSCEYQFQSHWFDPLGIKPKSTAQESDAPYHSAIWAVNSAIWAVYENLTVSLVNVCHFRRSNSIMLYTEAILFALCKHQATVCSWIGIVLYKFRSQENKFTRYIAYVILAKFAPQGSENRKILGSDPGKDFAWVYSSNEIISSDHAQKYSSDYSAEWIKVPSLQTRSLLWAT